MNNVQKLLTDTMGHDAYSKARAAYSQYVANGACKARCTVADRQLRDVQRLSDATRRRAVAVARAQCGRWHLCAVRELTAVLEGLHRGAYACEEEARKEIDALCKSATDMERVSLEHAAATAEQEYGVAHLVNTGKTVLVACELLRVRPACAGRIDDAHLLDCLPQTHKHLLHELLVGALAVHERHLADVEALLRGGSEESGLAVFMQQAERARAAIEKHFLSEAKRQGASKRLKEARIAVAALRGDGNLRSP